MSIDTAPSRHEVLLDFETDSISADVFKAAFRNHASGVALVTADPGDHPIAMTVSSLASVSAEPPLLVFSASAGSSSKPVLARAATVVVHFLSAPQQALAQLGATSGVDRFADESSWVRLPTGEPRFLGVDAWVRGRIIHRLALGGSVLYTVHVVGGEVAEPADTPPDGLVYLRREWYAVGDASLIG